MPESKLRTVHIRYYAQLKEALRTADETVVLTLPMRESEILEYLASLHPAQRPIFMSSRVALDDGYVPSERGLDGFESLDIISPVSGG